MKRFCLLLISGLLLAFQAHAQTGGKYVYNFLDFNYSGRLAGLGGGLIAVNDDDPSYIIYNPSMINATHHKSMMLHFTNYFANVGYGAALYSHTFKNAGSFAAEMRFVGYGKFKGMDDSGYETGEFSAGDYALTIGWGRPLNEKFSIGANLKLIYSGYEIYHSFGLAVDVAGSYYNEQKRLGLSILFKNIGSEIKPFTSGNYQKLPFDIQLALSQRFEHLPLRYHISLHSLHRWNMSNEQSFHPFMDRNIETGEYPARTKTTQFFDNFFRHLTFGIEIEPSKYFSLLFAYNHDRRQEMRIPQKKAMAGFSYGFNINIHSIRIGFSRAHYAVGATPNYITFSANLDALANHSKENKKKKLERLN